jgi:hypothetical protein
MTEGAQAWEAQKARWQSEAAEHQPGDERKAESWNGSSGEGLRRSSGGGFRRRGQ